MMPPPARGRWRLGTLLVAAVLVVALVVGHRPLLVGYARLFRVDDPGPSDAIVLLLGGWVNRPLRAAEVYQQGMAPRILLNASSPEPYPELCDAMLNRRALVRAGVPEDRIVVLPKVCTSTREEAVQVRDYVRTHGMRRIIVVTTAFHTARARWIFRRELRGMDVEVRAAAADDPSFNESNWYTNQGLLSYLEEGLKRVYYEIAY